MKKYPSIEEQRARGFDAKFYYYDEELGILKRKKFRKMGPIKYRFFQVLTWVIQAGDAIWYAGDWTYQAWKGTLDPKRFLDMFAWAHLESHLIVSPLLMVYWNYEDEVNYYVWLFYKFTCKYTYYEIIRPFVKIFLKSKSIAFFLLLP